MKENTHLVLAVFALVLSVAAAGLSYHYEGSPNLGTITGFVTDTATINLTVESALEINFTTDNIDFGSGRVYPNSTFALLSTSNGSIAGGNFTSNTQGLVLQNLGNTAVNLSIVAGKNANSFISGTNPRYEVNISNNEPGSCSNISPNFNYGVFQSMNTTSIHICNTFNATQSADTIRIDVLLVVPENSLSGALSDTITATAT